jgi:hypothetical protein
VGAGEVSPSEVSLGEIGLFEVCTGEVCPSEVSVEEPETEGAEYVFLRWVINLSGFGSEPMTFPSLLKNPSLLLWKIPGVLLMAS